MTRIRLDGFHALKHAIRFNAPSLCAHTDRKVAATQLAEQLAPDCLPWLLEHLESVSEREMRDLTANDVHPTRIVAFAERPAHTMNSLALRTPAVVLEEPRHLGNVGASIRASAGLGASAVICIGGPDAWHPSALRGSAGLHYALPVLTVPSLARAGADALAGRPLIGVDPEGDAFPSDVPANALLCFGTEREGLSDELLVRCQQRIRLPMRAGVSSLNLATSVAAMLTQLACGPLRAEFSAATD